MASTNKAKARQNRRRAPRFRAYENSNTRERNKIKRINRHLRRYGDGDRIALAAKARAQDTVRGYTLKAEAAE